MWFVFLDESGYTSGDWRNGIKDQPFYVVSAICLPGERLLETYSGIRDGVKALKLDVYPAPLGQGFEIKANEIASGSGWWKHHDSERNAVRDLMLGSPKKYGGEAIIVVIDKAAHAVKYSSPKDPFLLGFRFSLERIANFLDAKQAHGYCIYDHNTRLQNPLLAKISSLLSRGSKISGYSAFYEQHYEFILECDRVIELALGDSKHSLGLQIADYFATFTYRHFRAGCPGGIGWWGTLENSLRRVNGAMDGYGLKVFP